jgi:poly(glycerol-phosphate) alpha-glucosyltransferase
MTALVLSEWFDQRGFGLSAAAKAFSQALPDSCSWQAVVCHQPSGNEGLAVPIHYMAPSRLQALLKSPAGLLAAVRQIRPQVVHLHGIWTGAVALIPQVQALGARVVVSPHGMCEPYILQRGRWKKLILDLLGHRRGLAQADMVHALNQHEADCVRDYLGASCPRIEIVPNGVAGPASLPLRPAGQRRFLFCGRLDPKKNLEGLLDAWQASGMASQGHVLAVAGDGADGYAQAIKARAADMAGVEVLGHVAGETKEAAFAQAHFGILTSHSEGLPMAVLESLAYGMPCVVTPGCRMPQVADGKGWHVAQSCEAITAALVEACQQSDADYATMSEHAFAYAQQEHHWPTIGARLGSLYQELSRHD